MTAHCKYCDPPDSSLILELPQAKLLVPNSPHVSPREGGHLVVAPRAHVPERREMSGAELIAVDMLTMLAADALEGVFGAEWQNYQENGNWHSNPRDGHAHVHVYGRRRDAVDQPFGEALRFPACSARENWFVESPSPEQVQELHALIEARRHRYRAIAALIESAVALDEEI